MYHLTPTSPILLGLLALLAGHIQAQNATDTDSPVIDVLYITDETFGLSDFAGVDLVGSIAEAVRSHDRLPHSLAMRVPLL